MRSARALQPLNNPGLPVMSVPPHSARAFHCKFDGAQLCPSLEISGAKGELCKEIIARTCAQPIGLFDDSDFSEPCKFLSKKFEEKAIP